LDWILTEPELDPKVRLLAVGEHATVRGILHPLEPSGSEEDEPRAWPEPPALRSSEPCLLQHSSGTTGLQKAVVLSHGAVLRHAAAYAKAAALTDRDRVVSWLPLYHDLGLIAAFHTPLALGIPTVQMDPFE